MSSVPPPEVAHLVKLIGQDATIALIEAHGGTRIYVAQSPRDGSPLVVAIGMAAACRLAEEWGGTSQLKVPLAVQWRARIYQARGLSYSAIARKTGRSETTVWRLLQEDNTRQLALPFN